MKTNINDFINENLDKETKKEIHNLRTELNLCKKCLGKIEYSIDHLKKGPYDYGESADDLLTSIKDMIEDCNNRLKTIK